VPAGRAVWAVWAAAGREARASESIDQPLGSRELVDTEWVPPERAMPFTELLQGLS
jgi:hypothetical protein